jgi:hypothetical protein
VHNLSLTSSDSDQRNFDEFYYSMTPTIIRLRGLPYQRVVTTDEEAVIDLREDACTRTVRLVYCVLFLPMCTGFGGDVSHGIRTFVSCECRALPEVPRLW